MNINHVQQIRDFMAEEEIPKVEATSSSEHWQIPTEVYGVTSQKTAIVIIIAAMPLDS